MRNDRAKAGVPWASLVLDAEQGARLYANLEGLRHWVAEVRVACEPPAVTVEPGESLE